MLNRKEEVFFDSIPVYINDSLPEGINLRDVLDKIQMSVPEHLAYGVSAVYIEHLVDFDARNINAIYKNGSIYVTNNQDNEADLLDDIVHEIAHSVESTYRELVYKDMSIVNEFLGKKKRLLDFLKQEGYNISAEEYENSNYSRSFDNFLYKEVGYPLLASLSEGLFLSPYSITSVREYFAIGFEQFFIKNQNYVKQFCPHLYKKILEVSNI